MAASSSDDWQSGKTLSESASFMLAHKIATDVTFKFPNTTTTVEAHRFVLMAKSHVFYVMLNSILNRPGEAIEISDIEPAIFKEFLMYLYTDETTLSTEEALQFTYCAEKYEVTDLKVKSSEFLQIIVDETTVGRFLDHAVFYNDDALMSACQDIIESLESFSCFEEHHVTKDTMELVLGFQGLTVREVDIYKFCNTWAEQECTRQEVPVNASNRRKMLGSLLKKIPFCSMSQEVFATEVSGKHLLNGAEELQIYRFFCGPDKSNPPFPCKPKLYSEETFQRPCKAKPFTEDTVQKVESLTGIINCRLNNNYLRHTGYLNCVAVSPDDSMCATGDKDGKARLRDLSGGEELEMELHQFHVGDTINALCFCPSRFWLCAATGASVKIWNLKTGVIIDELRHRIYRSRFQDKPDDQEEEEYQQEVEQEEEEEEEEEEEDEPTHCLCLTWSADGESLYAGYSDKLIRIWQLRNLANWKSNLRHIRHKGYMYCMAISPDGTLCASGTEDRKAMVWDMDDGQHLRTIYGGWEGPINDVCFLPNRSWLSIATGPSIHIVDVQTGVLIDELDQEEEEKRSPVSPQCISLTWSKDGENLYAGYTNNHIYHWKVALNCDPK